MFSIIVLEERSHLFFQLKLITLGGKKREVKMLRALLIFSLQNQQWLSEMNSSYKIVSSYEKKK